MLLLWESCSHTLVFFYHWPPVLLWPMVTNMVHVKLFPYWSWSICGCAPHMALVWVKQMSMWSDAEHAVRHWVLPFLLMTHSCLSETVTGALAKWNECYCNRVATNLEYSGISLNVENSGFFSPTLWPPCVSSRVWLPWLLSQWSDDWMTVFAYCSSVAGRRYAQLQKQVEQLQEELYRSEIGNMTITVL